MGRYTKKGQTWWEDISSLKALIRTQSPTKPPTKPTKPATKPTKAPTQQRESTTQLTPMMLQFFYGSSLKMKRFLFCFCFLSFIVLIPAQ